jgi:hypothetical protein
VVVARDLPVRDPRYRVHMVAITTLDNRKFGSCPPWAARRQRQVTAAIKGGWSLLEII